MNQWIKTLALAAVLVVGSVAYAQESGPRQGRGQGGNQEGNRQRGEGGMRQGMMQNAFQDPLAGSGFALLGREDVQADLAMSAEQKTQMTTLRERWAQANRDALQQARQQGGDMQAVRTRIDQQMVGEVNAILSKEQQLRFEQIRIQLAGNRALISPKVQSLVGISSENRAKINTMATNAQRQQQAIAQQVRQQQITQEDAQNKMRELSDKFNADLEAMLTPADKAKLKEVGGREFKRAERTGRPGQDGAAGGGRPGRPNG